MKFIETLREGERISEVYLCKHKQTALTKAGKPYDSLILQDKTGTLDGKIWDVGSAGIEEFDSLDYIYVMGDVTSFQGALQLNVKRVKKMRPEDVNQADYLPVSEKNIDEMYQKLLAIVDSLSNPFLKQLAAGFFKDPVFEMLNFYLINIPRSTKVNKLLIISEQREAVPIYSLWFKVSLHLFP